MRVKLEVHKNKRWHIKFMSRTAFKWTAWYQYGSMLMTRLERELDGAFSNHMTIHTPSRLAAVDDPDGTTETTMAVDISAL